ncbi:MAG TPA: TyeA family type III secretion system gatekeeper subunit [Ramlibacter sp.]|uniref:TyeA family type III secretion system gatekeeper subunit n=1 Tax=Ramlibacter sp. TaxID=1917967 RepID=UPI002CCB9772|nr:TyeA family type III secretion system gatekeeper subunit [Ramlibacter sp.]HVZ45044.1 TyeA family type III secretion system gatekeeper subunit [Ramlibacter sp.]
MAASSEPLDANRLLSGLLDIIASGSALSLQFQKLGRELGIADGEPTIVFLSGLKKILRELPDKAFADRNARLSMVDAVQDALDQAIELEEEMQEKDEGDH